MANAPNRAAGYRRATYDVDKIPQDVQPANRPVERPTKFEFVLNLKIAGQSISRQVCLPGERAHGILRPHARSNHEPLAEPP